MAGSTCRYVRSLTESNDRRCVMERGGGADAGCRRGSASGGSGRRFRNSHSCLGCIWDCSPAQRSRYLICGFTGASMRLLLARELLSLCPRLHGSLSAPTSLHAACVKMPCVPRVDASFTVRSRHARPRWAPPVEQPLRLPQGPRLALTGMVRLAPLGADKEKCDAAPWYPVCEP